MTELKLKEYREMHNLSQRDVSNVMEITQAAYWKWEKGKSSPSPKQILQLCELFNCTPNELFGIKGSYVVAMDQLED